MFYDFCSSILIPYFSATMQVNAIYEARQAKKGLRTCATCVVSDHPTHAESVIRAFVLHSYILRYQMTLLVNSEGSDQTARMRRLIWALDVRICPKKRFRMARFIYRTNDISPV